MSMKNSNDTIGNQTRDLPACNAVPQPTALPRAPFWEISRLLTPCPKAQPYHIKLNFYTGKCQAVIFTPGHFNLAESMLIPPHKDSGRIPETFWTPCGRI